MGSRVSKESVRVQLRSISSHLPGNTIVMMKGLTVPNIVVLIRSTNVATDTRNSQPHIVRSSNIHICSNKQRRMISTHQDLKLTNTRYSHMISFRVQKSTGCASISSINRLDTTKITHRSSAHGNMKQMFFQKTDVQISATYG